MKKLFLFLTMGLIAGFVFFASCNDDDKEDPLTPQQERAQTMSGTWTIESATVPQGVDPTVLNGATMTFNTSDDNNPTSFSSSGMPDFFNAQSSASWSFNSSSIDIVVLSNVAPVSEFNINNITASSMSISFSHPGLSAMAGGRIADLSGAYTANLTK
jgi:hypothetical protein